MTSLYLFGWNAFFQSYYNLYQEQGLLPGRVATVLGHTFVLITETGSLQAELSGGLLHGRDTWQLPKVGDWVVYMPYDSSGYIIELLPRQNELARKQPGRGMEKQVLATNLDMALILQGLDRDFNLMRLQRYLHQVVQSRIAPLLILTKADLVEDPSPYLQIVLQLGYPCPVLLTSTRTRQGLPELQQYLQTGKTYVLLGSSGVGKSTLINSLLGQQLQQTGTTSNATNKGKHTTTTRHLIVLPNGSLLIDAPGMREFGITAQEEENEALHPLIVELATHCRFADCSHQAEPDCAVRAAVEQGELSELVYESFLKLLREQDRFALSQQQKRRKEKQFGKMAKQVSSYRKQRKY